MLADLKYLSALSTPEERLKFLALFGLMLVAAVLEAIGVAAIPLFVAFVVEPSKLNPHLQWIPGMPQLPDVPSMPLLMGASAILLAFVLFKTVFLAGVYYIQSYVASYQRSRLANQMFRVYQNAPYDWLLQRNTSEIQRNIQHDTQQVLIGVVMPMLDLLLAVVMSLSVVAVMVFATPGPTLVTMIVVGAALMGFSQLARKRLKHIGYETRDEQARAIHAIQQGFGAAIDAYILNCREALARVYQQSAERLAKVNIWRFTINKLTPNVIELIAVFGMLAIILVLIQMGDDLTESLPVISLIGIGLMRLKQIASKLAASLNRIQECRVYLPGLINDLQELEKLHAERRGSVDGNAAPCAAMQTLTLNRVTYTFPQAAKPAIRAVSLTIHRGESIALVGPTGSGKSTLANLILGLLEPQSGAILLNGRDIRENRDGWRRQLGYVAQSIFLLDDTIRANIALGQDTRAVDEARLQTAIAEAQLTRWLQTLPDGLDTIVGERGVRLSGGQRQRIGVARALYQQPDVLVMDEATSALDNLTEAEIMRATLMHTRQRTLILIAHRLTTVAHCDRLYYLEDGQLVAAGSFDELCQTSPAFLRMVEASQTT